MALGPNGSNSQDSTRNLSHGELEQLVDLALKLPITEASKMIISVVEKSSYKFSKEQVEFLVDNMAQDIAQNIEDGALLVVLAEHGALDDVDVAQNIFEKNDGAFPTVIKTVLDRGQRKITIEDVNNLISISNNRLRDIENVIGAVEKIQQNLNEDNVEQYRNAAKNWMAVESISAFAALSTFSQESLDLLGIRKIRDSYPELGLATFSLEDDPNAILVAYFVEGSRPWLNREEFESTMKLQRDVTSPEVLIGGSDAIGRLEKISHDPTGTHRVNGGDLSVLVVEKLPGFKPEQNHEPPSL